MREYHGALTPAEILAAMVNTAIDITGARAAVGRDEVTGVGLIDANAAIGALQLAPEGTIDMPLGNVVITMGESVHFSGTGTSPDGHVPLSFFWDFGGGAANSTLPVPGDVVFSGAGTFTVTFTVSDSQGSHDTTPATLEVTVLAPVTVSSNSGGGGGGGCTLDPQGAVDFTLLIVLSGILAYVAWRRRARARM
jgi:PKD repeat protein